MSASLDLCDPAVRPLREALLPGPDTLVPPQAGPGSVHDLLVSRTRSWERVWADTADWRLHRRGLAVELYRSEDGARLVLHGPGEQCVSQAVDATLIPPCLAEALPPGPVRDLLADVLGIRALLPLVSESGTALDLRVLDGRQKTVVRLALESTAPRDAHGDEADVPPPSPVVHLQPVRGYQKQARGVAHALRAAGYTVLHAGPATRRPGAAGTPAPTAGTPAPTAGTPAPTAGTPAPADETPVTRAWAALRAAGLRPGHRPGQDRPPVTPDTPAGPAVAAVLLGFLDELDAAVPGTLDDLDTEFLHDLRVASRRSRSALRLAGDALPDDLVGHFAPELKWVGDLTTPLRDLDVYLLGFAATASGLSAFTPEDLEPFRRHLLRRRTQERRALVRGLRSPRFTRLVAEWRSALEAVSTGETPDRRTTGGRPAGRLAAERIARADRRVVELGARIDDASPPERLHALRKRAKELRYVLDLFGAVLDPAHTRPLVRELKALQDVLGTFQDTEVQSLAIRRLAADLAAAAPSGDAVPVTTLLAMGELAVRLGEDQRRARGAFTRRFEDFRRPRVRGHVEALTGRKSSDGSRGRGGQGSRAGGGRG